jgi:uncharacterized protein (TIGR02646 family)
MAKAFAPGDSHIEGAWSNFLGVKARQKVETALDSYTWGKCAYCEQVAAKDIEHFQPKSVYPDKMFSWDNFLRGCKNCNNAKLHRFPVDAAGERLLIDPCTDEPLEYFVWDPSTGATGLTPEPARHARAAETRDLFHLDQEPLREERREAYRDVLYLLAHVFREDPVTGATRERLRDHLQPHRPWLGMIRQLFVRSEGSLRLLVEQAKEKLPEIQVWIAPWI